LTVQAGLEVWQTKEGLGIASFGVKRLGLVLINGLIQGSSTSLRVVSFAIESGVKMK